MHSPKIAQKILDIAEKAKMHDNRNQKFADAFYSMGPGCLFDDFNAGSPEEAGALKVLEWIEREFG